MSNGAKTNATEAKRRPPFETTLHDLNNELKLDGNELDGVLPAIYYGKSHLILSGPNCDLYNTSICRVEAHPTKAFLKNELSVSRLNDIHSFLWLAGRPMTARPLHRQKMLKRKIIVTEQIDLHLVWHSSYMYIKPMPTYLLSRTFWEEHLLADEDEELYKCAWGFLTTYTWLVCYESDFLIAQDLHLLPSELKWPQWQRLLGEFFKTSDQDIPYTSKVNKRYIFGELRLGRLNMIYRLAPRFYLKYLVQGYFNVYNEYGTFFSRNFAWLVTVFAYVTIIIIAMTLGLTTERLNGDQRFQNASYGFAVLSIIVPVAAVGVMIIMFLILFLNNFIVTRVLLKKRTTALGVSLV